MQYTNEKLGLSFELPDDWRYDESVLTITFFGPYGRVGSTTEVIQMKIGPIMQQYSTQDSREEYLAEPNAEVFRSKFGDETNVVILKRARDCEISIVRDKIHYTISHFNDEATKKAISEIDKSIRYPSPEMADSAIKNWT